MFDFLCLFEIITFPHEYLHLQHQFQKVKSISIISTFKTKFFVASFWEVFLSLFISLLCHVNIWKPQLSLTNCKVHDFPINPHQKCCVRSHRTKSVPNVKYRSALSSQICKVKTTGLLQLAVYLQLFCKFCKAEYIIFTELSTFLYFFNFSTSLMGSILQKFLPYFLDRSAAWRTMVIDTMRKP